MTTYTVQARRSGDWWALEVPQLPGVFSQVRRLGQAESMARDAIATMTGVDPADVVIVVEPVLEEDLARSLARFHELQAQQDALQSEANDLAAGTAIKLVERGYTLRDAGRVMGLSFQRVHQLAGKRTPRRRLPAGAR